MIGRLEFQRVVDTLGKIIDHTPFKGCVYAVGGCVRDMVMGSDIKDIDIVVCKENGGIRLAEFMRDNDRLVYEPVVYERFGTAMFRLREIPEIEIEAVHTRREWYPDEDSRNPQQEFGTIDTDCLRRDLTINSLYLNVTTGELVDFTGKGLDDITNKVIRTPCDPNKTYSDDPLRMLRCIRFATRFGWRIEGETFKGIVANAHRISIISRERVHDELVKIMSDPNNTAGIELLYESGLHKHLGMDISGHQEHKFHDKSNFVRLIRGGDTRNHMLPILQMTYQGDDFDLKGMKFTNDEVRVYNFMVLNSALADVYGVSPTQENYNKFMMFAKGDDNILFDSIAMTVMYDEPYDDRMMPTEYLNNIIGLYMRVKTDMEEGNITYRGFELPVNGNDVKSIRGVCGKDVGTILDKLTLTLLRDHNPSDVTRELCCEIIRDVKLDKRD